MIYFSCLNSEDAAVYRGYSNCAFSHTTPYSFLISADKMASLPTIFHKKLVLIISKNSWNNFYS